MTLIRKAFGGLIAVLVGVPLLIAMGRMMLASVMTWLDSLPMIQRFAYAVFFFFVGLFVLDRVLDRFAFFSPIALGVKAYQILKGTPNSKGGREVFEEDVTERVQRLVQRDGLAVDNVIKSDAERASPVLKPEVSEIAVGQTGVGKSSYIKGRMADFGVDTGIIAHGLAEHGGQNELENHLIDNLHQEVIRLSSRDSTHRWDPFLDFSNSLGDMMIVSQMLNKSRETAETGWSEGAKAMLTAAITVCNVRYGDIARLPQLLAEENPKSIIEDMNKIPTRHNQRPEVVTNAIASDDRALEAIQSSVHGDMNQILVSELFNPQLPRFSLTDYFADSSGRAVVLNNFAKDETAKPFYRFLLRTGINISLEAPTRQNIVLDEVDKLPVISNLGRLASAGRSAKSKGIIAFQNESQMTDKKMYGHAQTKTIWSNCPNRIAFRAGDADTAEMVLSSLGKQELESRSIAGEIGIMNHGNQTVTRSHDDKLPLTPNELMSQGTGEALVQVDKDWWLSDLTYSGY